MKSKDKCAKTTYKIIYDMTIVTGLGTWWPALVSIYIYIYNKQAVAWLVCLQEAIQDQLIQASIYSLLLFDLFM